ncbi:hypothetical protein [Microvirga mediterraneensis]|uniref:Uncharacterized protein n=1 Tax=Microvirga mediterraneensis TaxID=2754695 RepID=A0A838BKQ6_9HYPH|nr:hypothetical protein [Microvirga mediterraneensis]MBA1156234.1 hypothetical protein [Microvirga mediterraneensis]
MRRRSIKLLVVCLALTGSIPFEVRSQQRPDVEVATPEGLLAIGKWMLTAQGVPSDWLGEIYEGKNLREPINVIIVDQGASSAGDAKERLLAAAARAGYPIRFGHSTGYQGSIAGRLYAQLPQGRDDAFSNDVFEVNNNHGRVFGPHEFEQGYLFIAAFSREEVDPFRDPGHRYGSFNRARDDFTQRLDRSTDFRVSRFVDLGNALIGDPKLTTGDHDGIAVVVRVGP